MGDRGEVLILGAGIRLYDHYGAETLPATVRDALERGRGRWGDPEYITRIVFCEMVKNEVMTTTGYGISTRPMGGWRVVEVTTTDHDAAYPDGRVRVLDVMSPLGGDPVAVGRVVLDTSIVDYVSAGIHLERCPRCRVWVDLVAHGHAYEDGTQAGFRCDMCGSDYLYGTDGRLYAQGPDGIAEEIRPDGTTINHETAAQARTAALRGDLP